MSIARAFYETLLNYCHSSGALINKAKSVVYGWNVEPMTILRIAGFLGFPGFDKYEKIKYLGLPLTLGLFPPSLWLEVLAKLKEKIAFWGGQWLTKVGKLILTKVVLSAYPIFQSSLMLAPKSISAQISKLLRVQHSNHKQHSWHCLSRHQRNDSTLKGIHKNPGQYSWRPLPGAGNH